MKLQPFLTVLCSGAVIVSGFDVGKAPHLDGGNYIAIASHEPTTECSGDGIAGNCIHAGSSIIVGNSLDPTIILARDNPKPSVPRVSTKRPTGQISPSNAVPASRNQNTRPPLHRADSAPASGFGSKPTLHRVKSAPLAAAPKADSKLATSKVNPAPAAGSGSKPTLHRVKSAPLAAALKADSKLAPSKVNPAPAAVPKVDSKPALKVTPCRYCSTKRSPTSLNRQGSLGRTFTGEPASQQPTECLALPVVLNKRGQKENKLVGELIEIEEMGQEKLITGKYPSGPEGEGNLEISQYWIYPEPKNGFCSLGVVRVEAKDVANIRNSGQTLDFETEHLFEAQTLAHFIMWLFKDKNNAGTVFPPWPRSYRRPTAAWVFSVVLGKPDMAGVNPEVFVIKSPIPTGGALKSDHDWDLNTSVGGDSLIDILTAGFARSDGAPRATKDALGNDIPRLPIVRGLRLFALLENEVNHEKGTWFGKKTPSLKDHKKWSDSKFADAVRKAATPWAYMRAIDDYTYPDKTKTSKSLWESKALPVCGWIDLVLETFDRRYQWGKTLWAAQEPLNKDSTQPTSLRALWAYFIDNELREIEDKAELWSGQADAIAKARTSMKGWYDDNFDPRKGLAHHSKLKFPRPAPPAGMKPGQYSEYGAWGRPEYTIDAKGNSITLPPLSHMPQ